MTCVLLAMHINDSLEAGNQRRVREEFPTCLGKLNTQSLLWWVNTKMPHTLAGLDRAALAAAATLPR